MKCAILFSPYTCPQPLNFNDLFSNERGLSGSDYGLIRVCQEFVKLGHDVSLFTSFTSNTQPDTFDGVRLYKYEQKNEIITDIFDAVISWSCPDDFRGLPNNILRICYDMLNGFTYCQNNFDSFVDKWISVSEPHMAYQKSFNITDSNKWSVVPLGCDPEAYEGIEKVPGRMIWASSAERGLFNLLSIWPDIKKAVPEANLRVFYNFNYGSTADLERGVVEHPNAQPDVYEFGRRIRYMQYALPRLKSLGVEHVGSVSRERINKEMAEAQVMCYPCEPIAWSEGFSCSLLEATAAQACPIASKADALDHIYGNVFPCVSTPASHHLEEVKGLVIKALTDENYRNKINKSCKEFSLQHTWKITAEKLQNIILEHPKFGNKEKVTESIEISKSNLVKLNIAAGPNIWPYDWINVDKYDFSQYFTFIQTVPTSDGMPEHQKKLWKWCQKGNKIQYISHDMNKPFSQFKNNSADFLYVGQALEHISPQHQAPAFLKECLRILKPGGIIRLTTPDLQKLLLAYNQDRMMEFANDQPEFYKDLDPSAQLAYIMYGSAGENCTQEHYEGHFFCYSEKSIADLLTKIGFKEIQFTEPKCGKNKDIAMEIEDFGFSHSLIVEAVK